MQIAGQAGFAAALLCLFYPALVFGQFQDRRNFDVNRLRPGLARESVLNAESAFVPSHLQWDAALWANYANDPLVLNEGGQRVLSLLKHRADAHFVGAIALFGRLQIGLDIPLTIAQQRGGRAVNRFGFTQVQAQGVGDLAITPKVALLKPSALGLNIALLARVTLPSAQRRGHYFGERLASVAPELAVSHEFSGPAKGLGVVGNVAFMFRDDLRFAPVKVKVGDEALVRLGARFDFEGITSTPVWLGATLESFTQARRPFRKKNAGGAEMLAGAGYRLGSQVEIFGSYGWPLSAGYSIADWRVLAGLRISDRNGDPDGDALVGDDDACPNHAEDRDGFEDADGCPEADNDGDGFVDADDRCPNDAEDKDHFEDDDGCNDKDNDGDAILDAKDQCPQEAEDKDGFEDADGCSDNDNDGDGILDIDDSCPNDAEDKDGFEDANGCSDHDNDGDQIPDVSDGAPNNAEDLDGFEDLDGIPDLDNDKDGVLDLADNCPNEAGDKANQGCKKKQLVVLRGCKIEISSKVYFDTGRATIMARSFPVLDNLVMVIESQSQIKQLRIEGHTDSMGGDEANKTLSQNRAEAVKQYFVKKGIAGDRLQAVGRGEEVPIAPNATENGRAVNRRVEFIIENCVEQTQEAGSQP